MFNIFQKLLLVLFIIISGCQSSSSPKKLENIEIEYNLIKPGSGIYAVIEKNVPEERIIGKTYEKIYTNDNGVVKIERYDEKGKLSDKFSVPAITAFEYNNDGNVKYIKYFNSNSKPAENEIFGYWSVEYVYDEHNRVIIEIYRDSNSKLLRIPRDADDNIADKDFIAPILTYEYLGKDIRIKAFDKYFNLLKEIIGEKPCIPFIDCGDNQ